MLSRTAEYALRATLCLAVSPTEAQTARQLAQATAVSPQYLTKVLCSLVRAGVVRSQPGPGGGFTLTRDPSLIALLEVVEAVEPLPRIRTCPLGNPDHAHKLCPLHTRLDAAVKHIEDEFRSCSLSLVLRESDAAALFCPRLGEAEHETKAKPNGHALAQPRNEHRRFSNGEADADFPHIIRGES